MLELRGLRAFHGRVQVLWGVNLTVPAGEISALIGPNGAGKTSLLMALMGLIPAGGSARWQGDELIGAPSTELARRGLALVPEGGRVFPQMTVRDNLLLGRDLLADPKQGPGLWERVMGLFPPLASRLEQKAWSLSGGERQMLALGRALMGGPRLLLLDEPSLGLHPKVAGELFAALAQIRDQGLTILLVEQKVQKALELAASAHVLENGRVALSGPGPALLGDPHVKKAYLGQA